MVQPPSFGAALRKLRDDRDLSREKLAMSIGVSVSYVARLESGVRTHPGPDVLQVLIGHLDRIEPVSEVERRHLHELAGLPLPGVPTVAELRDEITRDMLRLLEVAEPNPACYFDIHYNLLSCNETYARTMPGVVERGNIMHWFFADEIAKQALADWDYDAAMMTAALRGMIGRTDAPDLYRGFLDELYAYPEFREKWEAEIVYDHIRRPKVFRDPVNGDTFAAEVNVFVHESAAHPGWIWFYLGRRVPMPER